MRGKERKPKIKNKNQEDGKEGQGEKSAWKLWLKMAGKKKERKVEKERKRRKEKGETDWEGNCYLFIVPSPITEIQ